MDINKIFKILQEDIHTTIMATSDEEGKPVTCAIDMMDFDKHGLYFLTAKGKAFYERLKMNSFVSLTGIKGNDTLSCKSITIRGEVKEIGSSKLEELFDKNSYMFHIYPTKESRKALTVFCLYSGQGELFDLSVKPIFREQFSFGEFELNKKGSLYIVDHCNNCKLCFDVCPQQCIVSKDNHASILQEHCLHCGRCQDVCPYHAIERR